MKTIQLFRSLIIAGLLGVFVVSANCEDRKTVIQKPDGTVETTEDIKYFDPNSGQKMMTWVYGVAVLLGSAIAYGGIRLLFRSMELGKGSSEADIDLDLRKQKLKINKLAQGGVVVLIGAAIVGWSLYQVSLSQKDNRTGDRTAAPMAPRSAVAK